MRWAHLDHEHQQLAALARTRKPDFASHNRRIAADSAARQRVKLRASKGSRLLLASDVHQLRLSDISGNLGAPLAEGQQRAILGRYIWAYIWTSETGQRLSVAPSKPEAPEFFALVMLATGYVRQGLLLPHPLLVLGVAPEDFRKPGGAHLPKDRQKKRFRAALLEAKRFTSLLQAIDDYFVLVELREQVNTYFAAVQARAPSCEGQRAYIPPPTRVIGRRKPMERRPVFKRAEVARIKRHDHLLFSQRRPNVIPVTNGRHPIIWLPYAPGEDEDERAERRPPPHEHAPSNRPSALNRAEMRV